MTLEIFESTNLSEAWLGTLNKAIKSPSGELAPFTLSLTGFEENPKIRQNLDLHLQKNNKPSIHTVSETIFPQSLYQYAKYNKEKLYELYLKSLPRLMAIVQDNKRGTYFQRLIDFEAHKRNGAKHTIKNQLEIIITALNSSINRRTQYQASIFDPMQDHVKEPYQRFPCLSHITFYKAENDGLVLNSFYPVQHLYTKAYGNWLGLINLGKFIAKETQLSLEKVVCFAGVQSLGIGKNNVRNLL